MAEIYIDSTMTDAERREALYRGAIFVYRPTDVAREFCAFADKLISEAFEGLDPEMAQYELPVERYIPPSEFASLRARAESLGFRGVAAGPLVRSSHRAGALWQETMSR